MRSKRPVELRIGDLLRTELVNTNNMRQELVHPSDLIDGSVFDRGFRAQFVSTTARPAMPTRLVAELLHLNHLYALNDEEVATRWVEPPYFQYLCGERYFKDEMLGDPSGLVRWLQWIGEEGAEWLLTETIEVAERSGTFRKASRSTIVVDKAVRCRAIAHPTDIRPLNQAREQLGEEAKAHGIDLRQSYARVGPRAELKAGRYVHDRQFRRGPDQLRTHAQRRENSGNLYPLHTLEAECNAKGEARTPHEFDMKLSVAATAKEGFVARISSTGDNLYAGHPLEFTLEHAEPLTAQPPSIVLAARYYRSVVPTNPATRLIHSHPRTPPPGLKRLLNCRPVVKPAIRHIKIDGLLDRDRVKGELGDVRPARGDVRNRIQPEPDPGGFADVLLALIAVAAELPARPRSGRVQYPRSAAPIRTLRSSVESPPISGLKSSKHESRVPTACSRLTAGSSTNFWISSTL